MAEYTIFSRNKRFVSSLAELRNANHNFISECMHTHLLSLEEAVASVAEFVPDVNSYATTAKKRCRQNSPLKINESAAIYLYTMVGPFYPKLNEALRCQNPSALKPWFPFLKLFLTALYKLPSCSTTVWRGVGEKIGDEFVEGAVHTWSSVNSCSSRVNVAGVFAGQLGTLFCIHTKRGKDITAYAANRDEEEIVLLPETHLLVRSTMPDSDGRSVVHLEECEILPEGQHMMLSYHSSSESIVSQIRPALENARIPVWSEGAADTKVDMRDSLAEGVENAAIVCCFISPDYEEAENCQLELQYAYKRGKRIILFILCSTQSWKPCPWLEPIMTEMERIEYYDDCEPDIGLGATGLILQIEQKPHPTKLTKSQLLEPPSYLYELVKLDYKRNSRIERFINPSQSLSIEQSYINLALVEAKEHQEKEKQLRDSASNNAAMEKFEEIHGTKTQTDIKDIFKTCKNNENKVLVFGRAGIGKSTFCRYVAHQWACGLIWSEYDLVALVPLRSLTEQNYPPLSAGASYDLVDVLRRECFAFRYPLSETDVTLLRSQYRKSRILWLLDGYDEIVQNAPTHMQHLIGQLLRTSHHIVTSRPYQNTLSYQVRMEIIGFTDENIPQYVRQFFNQVETGFSSSPDEETRLIDFLQRNPRIWGIVHIPINLELICSVWSETDWPATKTMTITMLYEKLSEWMCRRYLEKQRKISINEINLMDRSEVYHNCKQEMGFLESLAFRGMEKNFIVIPPKLIAEARNESRCSLSNHPHLLNIGLLKSLPHRGTGTQVEAEKDHYFVHLSFQEYFAARYLIHALQYGPRQKAIDFIQGQKYNRRFTLLLRFVSGLAVQSNCHQTAALFWHIVQNELVDLIGIRHIQLVMTCFEEVFYYEALPNHGQINDAIQKWIEHVIRSDSTVLLDHLTESLQPCTSITNAEITQRKFIQLLTTTANSTKKSILRFVSSLKNLEPNPTLLDSIMNQVETTEIVLKWHALDAIDSLGPRFATNEMIDRLVLAFGDKASVVRWSACMAVGMIGEKAATSTVIHSLALALGDEHSDVRMSACLAVERIGEKAATSEVIDRLLLALRDEDSRVRSSACLAVERIVEKATTSELIDSLVLALEDGDSNVRSSALWTIGMIGGKVATSAVIDRLALSLDDTDIFVRSSALKAVGRIGKTAATTAVIDRLVLALGDGDSRVRLSALETVGMLGEKSATSEVIDRLVLALGDGDSNVRSSALETIGKIGGKVATSAVIDRVALSLDDADIFVRSSALKAVGRVGEKAATTAVIDRLVFALGEADSRVRLSALETVGMLGEKSATSEVIDRLVLALGDGDSNVRSSALETIGKIGGKVATSAVIDRLLLALGDEDSHVRLSACEAIGRLGEKAATTAVIDRLVLALRDKDSRVRLSACESLGRVGEKAATSAVIDRLVLSLEDKYLAVRSSALETIGGIGEKAEIDEVFNRLLVAAQSSQDWLSDRFWKTVAIVLKLPHTASAWDVAVHVLQRYLLEGTAPLMHIIWTIGLIEGFGVVFDGNKIRVYGDSAVEVIELVDTSVIEKLVNDFTVHSVKIIGADCWHFSWRLNQERDDSTVNPSGNDVSY